MVRKAGRCGMCQVSERTGAAGKDGQRDYPCPGLGRLEKRAHGGPALQNQASLCDQRDRFIEVSAGTEFAIGAAEACDSREAADPQHGLVALLDSAMILFNLVVPVATGAMGVPALSAHVRQHVRQLNMR